MRNRPGFCFLWLLCLGAIVGIGFVVDVATDRKDHFFGAAGVLLALVCCLASCDAVSFYSCSDNEENPTSAGNQARLLSAPQNGAGDTDVGNNNIPDLSKVVMFDENLNAADCAQVFDV